MDSKLSVFYTENCNRIESLKRQEIKKEVIGFYSNGTYACDCCGENNSMRFLTIDHINDNGKEHRKQIKSSSIYEWLKSRDFPKDGYRVLCFNCNTGRYLNGGICPHEEKNIPIKETLVKNYELRIPPDWFIKATSLSIKVTKDMLEVDTFIKRGFLKIMDTPNKKLFVYKCKNVIEYTDNVVVTNPKGQKHIVEISGFKHGDINILKIEELLKFRKIKAFVLDNKLNIHIKNKELYDDLKEFILKNAG